MVRKWSATGVGSAFVPRLSPTRRKQIELELDHKNMRKDGRDKFLDALAAAVGLFDAKKATERFPFFSREEEFGPGNQPTCFPDMFSI